MAFCSKCGNEIKISSRFCGSCGENLPQKTSDASLENAKPARLVLSTSRNAGFLRAVSCYVILNEDGIILANLGKKRQSEELLNHRLKLKDEGVGFMKAAYSVMTYWHDYGKKYYTMPTQLILDEDTSNRQIPYTDVQNLFFKTARYRQQSSDGSNVSSPGKLIIQIPQEKLSFRHKYFDSKKNIKKILAELLGDKVRYKGRMLSFTIGGSSDMID